MQADRHDGGWRGGGEAHLSPASAQKYSKHQQGPLSQASSHQPGKSLWGEKTKLSFYARGNFICKIQAGALESPTITAHPSPRGLLRASARTWLPTPAS